MKSSPALFTIAFIFIVLVLTDLFLCFAVIRNILDFETARQEYLSYYPAPLQDGRLLTVISILMLSFSGYVFINTPETNRSKSIGVILTLLATILSIIKIYYITKHS